jgi:transposase-like protein
MPKAVCEAAGVCPRTVRKWVDRYNSEGLAGLQDRPPPPVIERIASLCRQRLTGQAIAAEVGVSAATVKPCPQTLGPQQIECPGACRTATPL